MYIGRKWPIARAEHMTEDGVAWIAESRAGTGTWVIREEGAPEGSVLDSPIRGAAFEFNEPEDGFMLATTKEQREALGMSDDVWHELEVQLRRDYEKRQAEKLKSQGYKV